MQSLAVLQATHEPLEHTPPLLPVVGPIRSQRVPSVAVVKVHEGGLVGTQAPPAWQLPGGGVHVTPLHRVRQCCKHEGHA
jgi:hypothetical protein